MFVMDVPPDVPPQYAPVVIAEASQAKRQSTERTIGVCHLVENKPEPDFAALSSMDPFGEASVYLERVEGVKFDWKSISWKTTVLQAPEHGRFESNEKGVFVYLPSDRNYLGSDRATLLVEIGGYKVKVIYHFNVMSDVPGSGAQGSPEQDKRFCPNGRVWKISLNPDDPNAPVYTFEHPYQLTSPYAGLSNVKLTFGPLAGGAVGQTTGNTITLDPTAAGHGWFLDPTPWDNAEYVATSNPNEWVALPGSAASGKIDLLTVLLHEYSHVLGLNHSTDTHSLMSEDLKPGVRHTVSVADLEALWNTLSDQVTLDSTSPRRAM